MLNVIFLPPAWNDYIYWQTQDRKTLKKINQIIKSVGRGENEGIGKSERLTGNHSGCVSCRIDEKNRFIYRIISKDHIEIISCRGHYDDK